MGQNYCKEIGLSPKKPISRSEFELLWRKYNYAQLKKNFPASKKQINTTQPMHNSPFLQKKLHKNSVIINHRSTANSLFEPWTDPSEMNNPSASTSISTSSSSLPLPNFESMNSSLGPNYRNSASGDRKSSFDNVGRTRSQTSASPVANVSVFSKQEWRASLLDRKAAKRFLLDVADVYLVDSFSSSRVEEFLDECVKLLKAEPLPLSKGIQEPLERPPVNLQNSKKSLSTKSKEKSKGSSLKGSKIGVPQLSYFNFPQFCFIFRRLTILFSTRYNCNIQLDEALQVSLYHVTHPSQRADTSQSPTASATLTAVSLSSSSTFDEDDLNVESRSICKTSQELKIEPKGDDKVHPKHYGILPEEDKNTIKTKPKEAIGDKKNRKEDLEKKNVTEATDKIIKNTTITNHSQDKNTIKTKPKEAIGDKKNTKEDLEKQHVTEATENTHAHEESGKAPPTGQSNRKQPNLVHEIPEKKKINQSQEDNLFSHQSMPNPSQPIDKEHLNEMFELKLQQVSPVLGQTIDDTILLLSLFHWDEQELTQKYFENPEFYLSKIGADVNAKNKESKDLSSKSEMEEEFECPVCVDDVLESEGFSLSCGHKYCKQCWQDHLLNSLSIYGSEVYCKTKCMSSKCNLLLRRSEMKSLADAKTFGKYQYFMTKAFVESRNLSLTFCPGDCGNAVQMFLSLLSDDTQGVAQSVVQCLCGRVFCFFCGMENHSPVTCTNFKQWQEKKQEDKESLQLITAISKPCPNLKCGVRVDRSEGCNHMTCAQCAHEWCWQCRQPWSDHGPKTGGFYFCNKYTSSAAYNEDQESNTAREEHNRYLHYLNGYHTNDKDEKDQLKQNVEKTAQEYQRLTHATPEFLFYALETLNKSRHFLKYTYIYGFFLGCEETYLKNVFEIQQGHVQLLTETLASALIETPPDQIDRQKIVHLTKVCETYVDKLMNFFENEEAHLNYAQPKKEKKKTGPNNQSNYWICPKCTYANEDSVVRCVLCNKGTREDTFY